MPDKEGVMAPGAVEEVGATTRSMVDAFKANPVMLGLVLVILAQVGLLFFVSYRSSEFRQREFAMLMSAQSEVQSLLARCVVPEKP
jgi:hypothetical protein